ncbi:MAG: hypothetical protein C0606_08130 [Hyphomicrobiales bacterium]|nr:MAG: hypothetical protein C0606_08130 [Hyphomicrobiales bacterium]
MVGLRNEDDTASDNALEAKEERRLARLRSLGLLDTPSEEGYDRITRLACAIFDVPIALIGFFDRDRVWFKSVQGLQIREIPLDLSLCKQVFQKSGIVQINDASRDPLLRENRLVAGQEHIRFYTGITLDLGDDGPIGSLCILDRKPRRLSPVKLEILKDLASLVLDEIRLANKTREIERNRQMFIDAVEALPDAFVIYDETDRLFTCNRKYRDFYRKTGDAILPGATFESIVRAGVERGQYPEAAGREEEWIADRLHRHREANEPIQQQLADGRWLRVYETKTRSGSTVGFRVDITELKLREQQLNELVNRDALTRTLSRRAILEIGKQQWDRANREGQSLAVIYCDLDHFKEINDRFSHAAGDEFLVAASRVMMSALRTHDFIGRLGGEEFLLILPETSLSVAIAVGRRICEQVEAIKLTHGGQTVMTTTSAGIAELKSGQSFEELLNGADKALYQAKAAGRNQVACG